MRYWLLTCCFLLVILLFRLSEHYLRVSKYSIGQEADINIFLLTEPTIQGNTQRIVIKHLTREPIIVIIPRFPEYHYADTLHIQGRIEAVSTKYISNQSKSVINNKNGLLTIYFPKVEAEKKRENLLLALISSIRQSIVSFFQSTLASDSASLLLGMVFGIQEGMSKGFRDQLRVSGVMHVVAASGMNVTLIAGFASGVFMQVLKRQAALVCTLGMIFFYCLLSGFEPSIIRASIMGSIVFLAQIVGRQVFALYSLFLAGYVMILVSPYILYDIGFQLSFLSTLGLVSIRPLFRHGKIDRVLKKSMVGDDLGTTIAAQLATLPVLLSNFGTYSPLSIVVNALVLWTVPVLMMLGGAGALIGLVIPALGSVFLYLSMPFLWYFEWIVSLFSRFQEFKTFQELPFSLILGYYFLLAGIILAIRRHVHAQS